MRVPCLCSLLFVLAINTTAQVPSSSEGDSSAFVSPVATLSKNVYEVNLAFTVTDKHGHFISNLRADDFHLLDNNQAPERLTFFQQRSDLPLHLAVLIDVSASVKSRFKFETSAATEFLRKILRPGIDKAMIITFNEQVKTVVQPTDRPGRLDKTLSKIRPDGDTALNDAVIYGCNRLRDLTERQITRRAIILISDGVDTLHHASLGQAQQAASRSEVTIFALSTNFSELDLNGKGDAVLRELASASGGVLLPAHDEAHLGSAFRNVEKALRNQYVIAYTPATFMADGSFRAVELKAVKHGLRTSCRKGYYAKAASAR